ncbi:MAG: hypothetical protein FWG21_02185 [Oscillospiraceae bacterium]|nr:hypothetical protein [Oscillospiraceae bacterium]
MNIKRFISIALMLILAFSLVACGGGSTPPRENATNPPPTTPGATPSDKDDPCPCCPNCVQKDCECAECGDSEDCECELPGNDDTQYDWRIFGEGEQPFTTPGMMGMNKMIVKLDLVKQGDATPAGTYTGTLYFWHHEMTPELMQSVGATGDSYNEFESDSFTVDIISDIQNKEWLYQTQEINVTITSVTDVTIAGRKQQVTDYPSQSVKFVFDINIETGETRMAFTLGKLEPIVFDGFQIEQSERS